MTKSKTKAPRNDGSARKVRAGSATPTDKVEKAESKSESMEEKYYVFNALFDRMEEVGPKPEDFMVEVPIDSLEANVGYSSLFRQMHQAFLRMVAYHRSPAGGSLSVQEARERAFHACDNEGEAKEKFDLLMRLPLENLDFGSLLELHSEAPRVAEGFWERAKLEGRKEFESGHLSANIAFPLGYMKGLWNIARYQRGRESFIDEWQPNGGI